MRNKPRKMLDISIVEWSKTKIEFAQTKHNKYSKKICEKICHVWYLVGQSKRKNIFLFPSFVS